MPYLPKVLYSTGLPATTGTTLYTVPVGTEVIVKNIVMANVTSSEATMTLSVVSSGDTASISNRILSGFPVPANGISTLDCSIVMNSGSFLYATNGTENSVTLTISGVEIS